MSYLVLARKYRPQAFEDVVAQDHVTRTLRHALSRDRIASGYLFCGPRGRGKGETPGQGGDAQCSRQGDGL